MSIRIAFGGITMLSNNFTLNGIKARTVGDGQHGTARWATTKEIQRTYTHVPFQVQMWRRGENRPIQQGIVLGSATKRKKTLEKKKLLLWWIPMTSTAS